MAATTGKRGRPRAVPQEVSQEEIDHIRLLCEDYLGALERIKANKEQIKRLEMLCGRAESPFEQKLYGDDLETAKMEVEEDERNTALIRWGLSHFKPRTRTVIEQLYIEGLIWRDIQDENGKNLSSSSVWHERNKGFKLMAIALRDVPVPGAVIGGA